MAVPSRWRPSVTYWVPSSTAASSSRRSSRRSRSAPQHLCPGRNRLRLPSGWRSVPADGGQRGGGRRPVSTSASIQSRWVPNGRSDALPSKRRPVHIHDVLADPLYSWREGQRMSGYRTILGLPIIIDDDVIGVVGLGAQPRRPIRRGPDRDHFRLRRADRRRRAPRPPDGGEARGGGA